jgi:hypothetical protein
MKQENTMPNFERVEVPRGAYIGWGNKKGQHVTGTVVDFDPTGGTDYQDNVCPQLEIELTDRAASFNKEGERTNFDAGELVVLTCGLVSLKRAVKKAEPARGDIVRITLENLVKVANGTVKEFGIEIARGAGKVSDNGSKAKAVVDDDLDADDEDDDEPPF